MMWTEIGIITWNLSVDIVIAVYEEVHICKDQEKMPYLPEHILVHLNTTLITPLRYLTSTVWVFYLLLFVSVQKVLLSSADSCKE